MKSDSWAHRGKIIEQTLFLSEYELRYQYIRIIPFFVMYFFFSLFACSPDSVSSEAPDAYGFTPDLLFIHELWLHPGDPERPMNPRGDANVSLKLYGPHCTRSPDDVCSWYGNLR